jgi:hypothetical protein
MGSGVTDGLTRFANGTLIVAATTVGSSGSHIYFVIMMLSGFVINV